MLHYSLLFFIQFCSLWKNWHNILKFSSYLFDKMPYTLLCISWVLFGVEKRSATVAILFVYIVFHIHIYISHITEADWEVLKTSKMELFAKTVNDLKSLTIFAKSSILDVCSIKTCLCINTQGVLLVGTTWKQYQNPVSTWNTLGVFLGITVITKSSIRYKLSIKKWTLLGPFFEVFVWLAIWIFFSQSPCNVWRSGESTIEP